MKKLIPLFVLGLGLLLVGYTLRPPAVPAGEPDYIAFGKLPVLVGGRIKPIDTVARTTLLQFQGRQTVRLDDGSKLAPSQWAADVLLGGKKADAYQVFEIVHPDLLALMNVTESDGAGKKRFSYSQLAPRLEELERQAQLAQPVEAQKRTVFQRAVVTLRDNLGLYVRLQVSLVPPDLESPLAEIQKFQDTLPQSRAAVRLRTQGQPHNEEAVAKVMELVGRFDYMSRNAYLAPIPPASGTAPDDWRRVGDVLLKTFATEEVEVHALSFVAMSDLWRANDAKQFNGLVTRLRALYQDRFEETLRKTDFESRFKAAAPFFYGMFIFVAALVLAIASWLTTSAAPADHPNPILRFLLNLWHNLPEIACRSAFYLLGLGFVLMTVGIGTRMWIEGRPPVTNLYSSALFVAWGSVGLCIVLEKIHSRGLASAAGGLIGFSGLIIAHHLSLSGDTMEMMRAVLDSNFWLATHVVIITLGYSATYLAGILAVFFIILGALTTWLDKSPAPAPAVAAAALVVSPGLAATASVARMGAATNSQMLERMVYGILCFATLFSLVGTILGGIWADQSWGRFWGWDPKENGALIIVLWNAMILHVRWGKLCGPRGFMALAVAGNIVTSWSWFGTNLLGVGLHSYGFTDRGFWALIIFAASQIPLILLATLPGMPWRSRLGLRSA